MSFVAKFERAFLHGTMRTNCQVSELPISTEELIVIDAK